jgi:hypothetical protein
MVMPEPARQDRPLMTAPTPSTARVMSARMEWRRPGLGRRLVRGAWAAAGIPILTYIVAFLLYIFSSDPAGPARWLDHALQGMLGTVLLSSMLWLSPALLVAGVVATYVSLPRPATAWLRVDAEGLHVEGERGVRLIPRGDIVSGFVHPAPATWAPEPHTIVELHLRDGASVRAEVASEAAAQAVLEGLGLGPEQRRVAITLGSEARQMAMVFASMPMMLLGWFILTLAMMATSLKEAALVLGPLGFFATAFYVWSRVAPARVVVGSEGLVLRRGVRTRTLSYDVILEVVAANERLDIVVESGDTVEIIVAATGKMEVLEGIAARIREAMARRGGKGASRIGELLDPQGRTLADWRASLRDLGKAEAGYRRGAVTPEALLAVLEDPAVPPARRIGAAMALRIGEHAEARARIRVAAEACADDGLREALEEAAEDELSEDVVRRFVR